MHLVVFVVVDFCLLTGDCGDFNQAGGRRPRGGIEDLGVFRAARDVARLVSSTRLAKGTLMSNIAAGWYDDGSGRQRWWDGTLWTEHYADASTQASAVTEPGILWQAVGKPLTGIGAGRYKLTKDLLHFEKGTLSLKAEQIHTHEIHDVDARQSMGQKARAIGTITLRAERRGGNETVLLEDIPTFREGVIALNAAAHEAREAMRVRQQTQHVNYSGAPAFTAAAPVPAEAAPAPIVDLNAELERLVSFKAQGVLDDAEFTAAKRKLLGL